MKIYSIATGVAVIVTLILLESGLVGFLAVWREWFWDAVANKDLYGFIKYLLQFAVAALLLCVISGYCQFREQYLGLCLRHRLTRKALAYKKSHVENINQRIQEDCNEYYQLGIYLTTGLFRNTVSFIAYGLILYIQLSLLFMVVPFVYAIIGTGIAMFIAKPLVSLNYINQNFEASFRRVLTKRLYGKVHRNNHGLYKTTKYLSYFQSFYNQLGVVFPYILLAPIYFSGKITFGVLMQCASSIGHIIDNLSYFINSFNTFNKWLSCKKRLKEAGII